VQIARPMPMAPPVTSATEPSSSRPLLPSVKCGSFRRGEGGQGVRPVLAVGRAELAAAVLLGDDDADPPAAR
jgi:hypothetical protein